MGWGARWILPITLSLTVVGVPLLAQTQASSPVIQLLLNARDVRTRVQAATTLGRLRPPGAREALETALGDDNAAVRAASAQALMTLGDRAALPALRSHANDPDPGVRAGVSQAVAAMTPSSYGGAVATLPGVVSPMGSLGAPPAVPAADWNRARFTIRVGNLSNRAGGRAGVVDVLRTAIVQEASRSGDVAVVMGALPPEAERRVRTGMLRSYALEGGVSTLRRWTVANTFSVRAEVSLVLMSEPARAIIGSLSGAATAQDQTPYQASPTFEQRLEDRALQAAVHGALGNLRQSLSTTH